MYCALKAHFTSTYQFDKYGGKIKPPKRETYLNRNDMMFFEAMANKNMDYILQFFVANFVHNENLWIGDLVINMDSEEIYFAWKKKLSRLITETRKEFSNIKKFIDERGLEFKELFEIKRGKYPILFRLLTERFISLETYLIMDLILEFSPRFRKHFSNDLVFEKWDRKVEKYKPFIRVDKERFKTEFKQVFA